MDNFTVKATFRNSNLVRPRIFALSLIPALAIGVLVLITIGAMTLTPRPGQEGVLLPAVIFIGCVFVAVHVLHLWLIKKTLHRNGHKPIANVASHNS
jgi:uncharacterized membrane protein